MKRFTGFKLVHGRDDLFGFSESPFLSNKKKEITQFVSAQSISLTIPAKMNFFTTRYNTLSSSAASWA